MHGDFSCYEPSANSLLSSVHRQHIVARIPSSHLDPLPHDCLNFYCRRRRVALPGPQDYVSNLQIVGCSLRSVSHALTHFHAYTQKDTDTHADTETKPSNTPTMRRFVCLCIPGSCSFCCRRILVVRTEIRPTNPTLTLLSLCSTSPNS